VSFPTPEPGLVIRYSYLWLREHRQGREEGSKDRPCAIVLRADDDQVVVLAITHSPPDDPTSALELPAAIKRHLGLDTDRSWVVLSESNVFAWPGPDLRPTSGRPDASVGYGFLPPRFFAEIQRRFLLAEATARSRRVSRSE
jgi:hypothetical protein